jgi:hypothetical protein
MRRDSDFINYAAVPTVFDYKFYAPDMILRRSRVEHVS